MGSEGIDIPQLNSIVLAMPKKDVDQLTGRVIRSVGASIDASIFDVVDESVDFFEGADPVPITILQTRGLPDVAS